MSEQLAIVGASARAAAASAARAGFDVVAADLFADDDLRRIAHATLINDYPSGLLPWLRGVSPAPATWMYTGALENHPDLVDSMAAVYPLWGNNGDVLRQIRDVLKLRDSLREAGLRFPETRNTSDGLPADGSWLVKTGRGASGSGVRRHLGEPTRSDVVYQKRVPGTSCSAVFIAAEGRAVLLGVVRQLVGEAWLRAREFQYCGAIGPWTALAGIRDQIEGIGNALAKQFPLIGLFGVDFVVDDDQLWTIEVNPRYTASVEVVERATGLQALAIHADACREGKLPLLPVATGRAFFGKAILFAKRDVGVAAKFSVWTEQATSKSAPWPLFGDLPSAGTMIAVGRPVITAFATGATADKVAQELANTVAIIEHRLYSDFPSKV